MPIGSSPPPTLVEDLRAAMEAAETPAWEEGAVLLWRDPVFDNVPVERGPICITGVYDFRFACRGSRLLTFCTSRIT